MVAIVIKCCYGIGGHYQRSEMPPPSISWICNRYAFKLLMIYLPNDPTLQKKNDTFSALDATTGALGTESWIWGTESINFFL